jgi:hypothetical protein
MVRTRKTQIYPLQLTVNFWEIRPSLMAEKLDRLSKQGIRHLTAFVPWQLAESDIQHSLTRFLDAVLERDLSVSLVLTPELGVKFPYSGVPKDLATDPKVAALDHEGNPFFCTLPPVWFSLPSFHSPEVWSRYGKFLQKCEGWILDFFKKDPTAKKRIQVVLTGGFHRYYRSFSDLRGRQSFSRSGDESKEGLKAFSTYAKAVSQLPIYLAERGTTEFQDHLRNQFFWESERLFRTKQAACFKRLGNDLDLIHLDLLSPEADPAMLVSSVLNDFGSSFQSMNTLNRRISEELRVVRTDGKKEIAPAIHWSSLGIFGSLKESERQFLLWKTLLNAGSRKGALFLSEEEFNRLQPSFRKKLGFFADLCLEGELRTDPEVIMVSNEDSSHSGLNAHRSRFPNIGEGDLLQVTDFSLIPRFTDLKLVLVDDPAIIDSSSLGKLIEFSRKGGTVALSTEARLTELAKVEWKEFYDFKKSLETPLGGGLEIYRVEQGQWIVYEKSGDSGREISLDAKVFQAIYSLAEVSLGYEMNDGACELLALKKKEVRSRALFLMNPKSLTQNPLLSFGAEKEVCDFLETYRTPESIQIVALRECRVEVPSHGILSLQLSGFGEDERERALAEKHAVLTESFAMESAKAMLPGFQDEDLGGSEWSL